MDSLDASFILLDSTGATCSLSDSSVICLDSSSSNLHVHHVKSEYPDRCIIIPDSSEDEEVEIPPERKEVQRVRKTGGSSITVITETPKTSISDSDTENKEPMPDRDVKLACTPSASESKRRKSNDLPSTPWLLYSCTTTTPTSDVKANLPCTPSESESKRRKISDQPLASTPLAGSAIAPTCKQPAVTPITVKYERIRAELSATKKEQKKQISEITDLQKDMLKFKEFKEEMANKRKREEEEEKKAALVPLDVKSNQNDGLLRPVIIDASNVAMSHGNHKIFSCKGIALCIQYFQRRGHTNISALVPLHRKTADAARFCPIKDAHILDDLESKGFLSFTPSRNLNGRRITPYDDRMMLQLACRNGGVVVSNDNYRDLMNESVEFRTVIANRLIMYVFVGDHFMVPEDPHGRHGPKLDEVLKRPEKAPLPSLVHSAVYNHNRRAPLEQLRYQWQHRF